MPGEEDPVVHINRLSNRATLCLLSPFFSLPMFPRGNSAMAASEKIEYMNSFCLNLSSLGLGRKCINHFCRLTLSNHYGLYHPFLVQKSNLARKMHIKMYQL